MLGIKKASLICSAGLFKELVYVRNQEGQFSLYCWSV